ncbi:hypothetical protein AB5I41_14855 [Sphingomonas sp. MMS24-JH45]
MRQLFGMINWTMLESKPLMTRKPGWKKIMASTFFGYVFDLPRRLRQKDGRVAGERVSASR